VRTFGRQEQNQSNISESEEKYNMKRILALALVIILAVGLLAGCGNNSSAGGTTTGGTTAGGSTTGGSTGGGSTSGGSSSGGSTSGGSSDTKKPIDLSLSIHDSATSIKGVMYDEWCKQVNEASNGTLNVTLYAGGVLATEKNGLDAMESGACDIVWVFTTWYPTMFYLCDIVSLPMMGIDSAHTGTNILWDLYEQSPEMAAQFKDYKVIHIYTNPVSYMHFAKKPVNSLADLKGMNIRTSGGTMGNFVARLGANSMTISASELYESLEKGIVDGFVQNGSGIGSWNLQEVTKYFLDVPLYVGTWLLLMKQETYDALPDEAKAAIDAYSGRENSLYFADAAQDESTQVYSDAVAAGQSQWIELSDENYAEFKAVADEFGSEWVGDHAADGFDAQAYYDLAMSLIKK